MVWTKSNTAQNKRNEEETIRQELGLSQTQVQVQVHTAPSNRLRLWNKRTDEELGEGEVDLDELRTHFKELISDCLPDTDRRKQCLETAKEYAGMTDFKSARRYLEANYLGPNPWTSEEDKKLLADIKLKREASGGSLNKSGIATSTVDGPRNEGSQSTSRAGQSSGSKDDAIVTEPKGSVRSMRLFSRGSHATASSNSSRANGNESISRDASQNKTFSNKTDNPSEKTDESGCCCCGCFCKITQFFCGS